MFFLHLNSGSDPCTPLDQAAIHGLITNVYDAFNNNQHCMSIFLDLSKAFDSIDRNIALKKLHC